MAIRTDIVAKECTLTYTNGQVICADDLLALLDFAKNALSQGDTVVSESERVLPRSDAQFANCARVGFPFGNEQILINPITGVGAGSVQTGVASAEFLFECSGQNKYCFLADVRPGERNVTDAGDSSTKSVRGKVKATLYDHTGNDHIIYDSAAAGTPFNVTTEITVNNSHSLVLPTQGETEIWRLKVEYSIHLSGETDVYRNFVDYEYGLDGAIRFSLKLYTVC